MKLPDSARVAGFPSVFSHSDWVKSPKLMMVAGAGEWDRTTDLLITNQLLYH